MCQCQPHDLNAAVGYVSDPSNMGTGKPFKGLVSDSENYNIVMKAFEFWT